MKYEYMVVSFVRQNIKEETLFLNEMGKDGWRLVAIDSFSFYYFERAIV